MRPTTKTLLVFGGAAAVLAIILASSRSHAKSAKPKLPVSNDDDTSEEIEVTFPNKDGSASDNGVIVKDDVIDSTEVDDELEVVADEYGLEKDEAIKEVVDSVTGGEKAPPLAIEEISPEFDPKGTVKLARLLLVRETLPNWKADDLDGDVGEWQRDVNITSDNKFGIESVAKMAEEVGILPLVRYWPKDVYTKQQAIQRYTDRIYQVMNQLKKHLPDSQAHIDALTASVNREKAVTFGTVNPPSQSTREWIQKINDGIGASAELKTIEEIKNAS